LLDTMAQAQTGMMNWLTRLSQWSNQPAKKDRGEEGGWKPPRVSEAEAVEQAAGMMERVQRMFLRALRALTELRRRPLAVVVQGAGQVNIAHQQVNVAGQEAADAIVKTEGGGCAPRRATEGLPELR